ncbi:YoaK family protein [Paeniglutamicibacter sp. NPDC091659]|uniref:YoaK family protein n=1 Tax=Paeniglutamicibacter sp. NPDC091659 TaxID=3364389 RepID=UPI00382A2F6F
MTSIVGEETKTDPSNRLRKSRPRISEAKLLTWLMLAMTFSTGIIDAVGYLGLDRVFTGNMTGNVVILGMALSGTTDLPVLGPAMALVLYFLGAVVGGRLLRGHREGWTSATTTIFGLVSAMLLACAIFTMVVPLRAIPHSAVALAAVLGFVMGAQAAAARQVKIADVTTVVVTSTITGLAADSWFGARLKQDWVKRLTAVLLILLGALCGAFLLPYGMWIPILASACLSIAVTFIGEKRRRAERSMAV